MHTNNEERGARLGRSLVSRIRITRSDTSGFTLRFRLTIRVSEIVNERHGITADTALRLARHFGTNADSWMNLQRDDELILT